MQSFRNFIISFLTAFCITALVFGTAALIVVPKLQNTLYAYTGTTKKDQSDLIIGFEPASETEVSSTEDGFSVLLIGTDKRKGVSVSSVDSLIFVKVCPAKNAVVYYPIPTTSAVTAGSEIKLLSDYHMNNKPDVAELCEKAKGLVGMNVNYYAIASLTSFANIVDDLGGVEFNVPDNYQYSDPDENLEISIAKGYQVLDGDDAAKLMRYCSDGFDARMTRNAALLKSIIRKYTSEQYKVQAVDIFNKVADNMTTDFTETDMATHLEAIFNYSKYDEIDLVYPGDYEKHSDGSSTFTPNTALAYELIADYR